MSIRSRGRGSRALPTRIATVFATAAVLVPAAAQPASAYVPCPTHPVPAGNIVEWDTKWPTPGANPKGVTQCLAMGSAIGMGYLQIVDLQDGASIRLHSELAPTSPPYHAEEPNTLFTKRTAKDWYSFIKTSPPVLSNNPPASRLFSTTNASFFKNSTNGSPTALPFPQWSRGRKHTLGVAAGNPNDPDHHAPKKALLIGYPGWAGSPQPVRIAPFPTYLAYPGEVYQYLRHASGDPTSADTLDATVSFDAEFEVGDPNRRNYIGVHNQKVYIFTSVVNYSSAEAAAIMEQIQPGMDVMQLDGGGSAQTYSDYAVIDSSIPVLNREVPDVLAVYKAP